MHGKHARACIKVVVFSQQRCRQEKPSGWIRRTHTTRRAPGTPKKHACCRHQHSSSSKNNSSRRGKQKHKTGTTQHISKLYLPTRLPVRDLDIDSLEGSLELATIEGPQAAAQHLRIADTEKLAHEFHLVDRDGRVHRTIF